MDDEIRLVRLNLLKVTQEAMFWPSENLKLCPSRTHILKNMGATGKNGKVQEMEKCQELTAGREISSGVAYSEGQSPVCAQGTSSAPTKAHENNRIKTTVPVYLLHSGFLKTVLLSSLYHLGNRICKFAKRCHNVHVTIRDE